MADTHEQGMEKLIHDLKRERDELKVQIHLGSMELKEEWDAVSDKLNSLSNEFEPLKAAVGETADSVWESLKLVGAEVRDGFARIRSAM